MANERQLIDPDELLNALPTVEKDRQISLWGAVADFVALVMKMPIVDAVEVVRCKDCKNCSHDTMFGCYWCNGDKVNADDFCSCGERRADGQ